jgi:hypothetical protein
MTDRKKNVLSGRPVRCPKKFCWPSLTRFRSFFYSMMVIVIKWLLVNEIGAGSGRMAMGWPKVGQMLTEPLVLRSFAGHIYPSLTRFMHFFLFHDGYHDKMVTTERGNGEMAVGWPRVGSVLIAPLVLRSFVRV